MVKVCENIVRGWAVHQVEHTLLDKCPYCSDTLSSQYVDQFYVQNDMDI